MVAILALVGRSVLTDFALKCETMYACRDFRAFIMENKFLVTMAREIQQDASVALGHHATCMFGKHKPAATTSMQVDNRDSLVQQYKKETIFEASAEKTDWSYKNPRRIM